MTHKEKRYMETILRRMNFLSERLSSPEGSGNGFYAAELSALSWLINEKEEAYYARQEEKDNNKED